MSVPQGIFTGDWHEQDPRWTAVDSYTLSHLHPSSKPNHAALNAAFEYSRDQGLPNIATYPVLSKLLALQCKAGRVKHVLKDGTLGGLTPIWLPTMNLDLHVVAVEIDPHHANVARANVNRAGVGDRVEIMLGNALDVLPRLLKEIEHGSRPRFGFTYIDKDKENNWAYFDLAVRMSLSGACLYVDNIVRRGALVDEEEIATKDEDVLGARLMVENAGKDPRVEAVVQQTVAEKSYDGFLMAVVL